MAFWLILSAVLYSNFAGVGEELPEEKAQPGNKRKNSNSNETGNDGVR